AHAWELDPAGYDAVWALRESGRIPDGAAWFTSPEPKAVQTAQLLTDGEVAVVEALREQVRDVTPWYDDAGEWQRLVRSVFERPDVPAREGWEPLAATRSRLLPSVRAILDEHADADVVLVGHGTAWTLLASELTGRPPDLDRWAALAMPDVIAVEPV
ncbi:MAG TPA: histidine phosphatase family protein, partial [Candidatus Nanopelagicales bacterium]|nr:histidine phosphatase family protein [Candidatus Nanopelagicales bacterium]